MLKDEISTNHSAGSSAADCLELRDRSRGGTGGKVLLPSTQSKPRTTQNLPSAAPYSWLVNPSTAARPGSGRACLPKPQRLAVCREGHPCATSAPCFEQHISLPACPKLCWRARPHRLCPLLSVLYKGNRFCRLLLRQQKTSDSKPRGLFPNRSKHQMWHLLHSFLDQSPAL